MADTLFEWQRNLLRELGCDDAMLTFIEEHLVPDDEFRMGMVTKSFAARPDMASDVPIPARPGAEWNSVEVVWGRRAYKQLAVQVISLLMQACGWDVKVLTRKDLSD